MKNVDYNLAKGGPNVRASWSPRQRPPRISIHNYKGKLSLSAPLSWFITHNLICSTCKKLALIWFMIFSRIIVADTRHYFLLFPGAFLFNICIAGPSQSHMCMQLHIYLVSSKTMVDVSIYLDMEWRLDGLDFSSTFLFPLKSELSKHDLPGGDNTRARKKYFKSHRKRNCPLDRNHNITWWTLNIKSK